MGALSPLTDQCLDAFFTSAPAALGLLDRDLRLVKLNDRGAEMIGLPPALLLGRPLRAVVPAMADRLQPLLARILATGTPLLNHHLTGETPGQPGVIREWVVSFFPVPAGTAAPPAIGVIAVEQSEQPPAEAAWWRSEAELRALVEQAAHGIYYSTLDGRFLRVNPALVRMLGYDSETEVLALSLPDDVYVEPRQRERLIAEYRRASEIKGVEAQWRRRDGRQIFVRLSGRPLRDDRDALTGFSMIAEDVTEQRRMSRALAQAQKMEAIGQLTSGIAHDFNNLLTVILAHAKFIGDELPGEPPEVHDDLRALRAAAHQGAELVHKVLALSRTDTLDPRPFDLVAATRDVLATLRRMLPSNIEIRVSGDEPVRVHADPGALQQILLNLATNARDAMPEGGTLQVAVRRDQLAEEDRRLHEWIVPGSYGALEIGDTGTGMDAETLAHVFEPFFTTKAPGVGTGLGLAMVYGLVKQQGGFVLLHSEVGVGTTARIYLPLTGEESPAPATAHEGEPALGGSERILLLEDDPHLRRVAERVLARAGYRVRSAADAATGLAMYDADPDAVDLIVTDFMMPVLDGVQLYRELRRQGRAVKMVITSGYSGQRLRELVGGEAGVAFVIKPWTSAELLRTVRAVLEGAG